LELKEGSNNVERKQSLRDETNQPNTGNDRNNSINAKDKLISKVSYDN